MNTIKERIDYDRTAERTANDTCRLLAMLNLKNVFIAEQQQYIKLLEEAAYREAKQEEHAYAS